MTATLTLTHSRLTKATAPILERQTQAAWTT
jgi:hypothetical protein